MENQKITVIGAGRVGTTIAAKISQKKDSIFKIKAISSRSDASLSRAKKTLEESKKEIEFYKNNKEAIKGANLILVCTPDDIIKDVSREIFTTKESINGSEQITAIHFSGSKPLDVLKEAKEIGIHTASTHPIKSFASIDTAIKTVEGTIFGITYSDETAGRVSKKLVGALGGKSIVIEDSKKSLYHASACIASNFLVALINYAVRVFCISGADEEQALDGLAGLIEGTVKNIIELGSKKALTGPIARGDMETIRQHIKDLEKFTKRKDVEMYKTLGVETARIARYNKWLEEDVFKEIMDMFTKKEF